MSIEGKRDAFYPGYVVPGSQVHPESALPSAAADTLRLDFMISEECQIEHLDLPGKAPLYRVRWPYLEEHQREWSASPREAIDAAMRATQQEGGK